MTKLFAVIDCETTGLNTARSDRIVELAAVVIDPSGAVVREFVSLVNPRRDVGKTSLHGISASDVADAPAFPDIIGHVTETLDGTIALAAHNVGFDHRFLRCEFERAGFATPDVATLCTMRLSGGGTLECCCNDMGIEFDRTNAHSALEDARAAARLLARLFADGMIDADEVKRYRPVRWPQVANAKATPLTRLAARNAAEAVPSYVQRLLAHAGPFPVMDIHEHIAIEYLGTLERVLEDRLVDAAEGDSLVSLARAMGLDGDAIQKLHNGYLERLIAAALDDGVVTEHERRDLDAVAHLLGFDHEHVHEALGRSDKHRSSDRLTTPIGKWESLAGKRVCFTGESICSYRGQPMTREAAADLARTAGLEVADSVTKKLDILVVADPHTQSGKARKARQYSTRVIHEPVFWQMLGISVE
jgi:DNA polymerase-3 subunit epsilon